MLHQKLIFIPILNDGNFDISINEPKDVNIIISVYNILGKKIFEMKDLNNNGKSMYHLDLSSFSSGIYTVVLIVIILSYNRKIIINR